MSRRSARVSEAQWGILLEHLERHPNLARSRGYNNTSQGRAESRKLWDKLAALLNAEGSGTTKNAKDWSIYVSNYKSKLKKMVADINADAGGTGGGPPRTGPLSEVEARFLAIMGEGFGQTAPQVSVDPLPSQDQQSELEQSSLADMPQIFFSAGDIMTQAEPEEEMAEQPAEDAETVAETAAPPLETVAETAAPPLPRRTRHTRYRTRPLAPLDEARRILSQVEMQRAAADAASARALAMIGQNLGRIADAIERYLTRSEPQ